jgi:hypothetical protein
MEPNTKPHIISGIAVMEWLEQQGIIPVDRPLRRVIIDAPFDGPVIIYWEELGSESLTAVPAPVVLFSAVWKELV